MNLGQTMITMGMFVLLIMSVISANRMILENAENNLKTEALTGAATVAQNLMAEAMSKKFDASSNDSGHQDTSAFTSPSGLGPTSSEHSNVGTVDSSYTGAFKSPSGFNDFDDYHGYKRIATGANISGFVLNATVFYVDSSDPEVPTGRRTYYKVLKVTVTHPLYIEKPLVFMSMLSY